MPNRLIYLAIAIVLFAPTHLTAKDTLRLSVSLGLTGKYAEPSAMQKKAYKLWEMHINAKGGLLGKNVSVIIEDDKSNAERARRIYQKFVRGEKVDLIFGPYSSEITKAVAPVAEKYGYPLLASGAASDSIWQKGYQNIFGLWAPASRYTTGILQLAFFNGLKEIAVVHADDEFSREIAWGVKRWAPHLDLHVAMCEEFAKGQKSLIPLAKRARVAQAELLIVGGHLTASIAMRRSLSDIGWIPRAYFATVGPAMTKYQVMMGKDAEFTYSSSIWEPESEYAGAKEFAEAFKKKYQEDPSYHAATAYAAGQIIEAAVELAGSADRKSLREALLDLKTDSIIGRYAVDKTGLQIKSFPLTIQWLNGKKKIVWWREDTDIKPVMH